MKKLICLCLCSLMLLSTLVSCNKLCSHTFSQGVCSKCEEKCEHNFENGICGVCEYNCEHNFNNGVCSICIYTCPHSYDKGVCLICNNVNITNDDMKGRVFKYAYFELQWSEDATDLQKETLLKKHNKDTDEELFDLLHSGYMSAESITSLNWDSIDKYKFSTANGRNVAVYVNGKYSDEQKCFIDGNRLKLGNKNLYYAKDRIYLITKSKQHSEISLKVFFVEI